ncbi:MAG TPA: murein L,D-transpeptidase catalytic domain family protein [Bdellovibrionota bacterium]|jgi:hypothetical protein
MHKFNLCSKPKNVLIWRVLLVSFALGSAAILSSCAKERHPEVVLAGPTTTDSDGQPVADTVETVAEDSDEQEVAPPTDQDQVAERQDSQEPNIDVVVESGAKVPAYQLPKFDKNWGMSRAVYDRGVLMMKERPSSFANKRYVVLIDFSKHSSTRRFFLFDLNTGKLERYHVAHGKGSDPRHTGYAQTFSNRPNSRATALGAYKTAGTYYGGHGLQLRLDGLEKTNSNSRARAVVIHGARYVNEAAGRAGRSWGCPSLDRSLNAKIVNRIKGGAFLLIWK